MPNENHNTFKDLDATLASDFSGVSIRENRVPHSASTKSTAAKPINSSPEIGYADGTPNTSSSTDQRINLKSGGYERDGYNDGIEEDEDERNNEFLNSSSFFSNSEIIRTSNVNSFKSATTKTLVSPTPATKSTSLHHFQLGSKDTEHVSGSLIPPQEHTICEDEISDSGSGSNGEEDEHYLTREDKFEKRQYKNFKSPKYIDIDDPSSTPNLPKINPETTPWRKLRHSSTYSTKSLPPHQQVENKLPVNFMKSLFDETAPENALKSQSPLRSISLFEPSSSSTVSSSSTGVTNQNELESLRKEITSYKLQHKLLIEFIRSVVKGSGKDEDFKNELMQRLEKENNVLFSERQRLQKNLKEHVTSQQFDKELNDKYDGKIKEILELKNDLKSTSDLNKSLSTYIDELKNELEQQQKIVKGFDLSEKKWKESADNILSNLNATLTDENFAVVTAQNIAQSLDAKLEAINSGVSNILDSFHKLSNIIPGASSKDLQNNVIQTDFGNLTSYIQESKDKLSESVKIEKELRILVEEQSSAFSELKSEFTSLEVQFKENLRSVSSLKKLLDEKRKHIQNLNKTIKGLQLQVDELSAKEDDSSDHDLESQFLKNRVSVIKLNHKKEVESLLGRIDDLEAKLSISTEHLLSSSKNSQESKLADLQDENKRLKEELILLKSEKDSTINDLQRSLKSSDHDLKNIEYDYKSLEDSYKDLKTELAFKEKEYKKKLEIAAGDLNNAVTRQRALGAEKSKLTFALDALKRDKTILISNNSNLTEKIVKLEYQVSKLSKCETEVDQLFSLQVQNLQNGLDTFSSVLEQSSVDQAKQKLEKLIDPMLDFDQIHAVLRSLFAYFENATCSLIADHSQLLINSNLQSKESKLEVNRLKKQIASLTEELNWCMEQVNSGNMNARSRLRIEELEKRRKSERERRKLENQAAEEMMHNLEKENHALQEKVNMKSK